MINDLGFLNLKRITLINQFKFKFKFNWYNLYNANLINIYFTSFNVKRFKLLCSIL